MSIAITPRDRALLHATWSLGAATHETLRALISPQTQPDTLRRRLRQLHRAGYLVQTRHVGPAGCIWLYSVGRLALQPNEPRPWRPGLAQLSHTIAVGEAVVALTRPGFAEPLVVTGWQGEAELRAWARPGAPFPDARITWRNEGAMGAWLVEVDRATESRAAWRRKMVRYLILPSGNTVLALTTTMGRAKALANVASEIGVDLCATTLSAVQIDPDAYVYDAGRRANRRLSDVDRSDRKCALRNRSDANV